MKRDGVLAVPIPYGAITQPNVEQRSDSRPYADNLPGQTRKHLWFGEQLAKDSFVPLVGQTFTIITAANVSGVFDTIISCAGLSVTYNPTSVVLTITSTCAPCLADTNGDSTVNVIDLLAMLAAWGPNPGHPADINNDGNVTVIDLLAMLAAWGACP